MDSTIGEKNGVTVDELANGGFAVEFPFDRQLSRMILAVPGAAFVADDGRYHVPAERQKELSFAVAVMRDESILVEQELEKINALVAQSVKKITPPNAGDAQISSFIQTGKIYAGEVLNVNSRFLAQHTGYGAKDNAPFVMIHRLANLETPWVEKGDPIVVEYDSTFVGRVQYKPKTFNELESEFKLNAGQRVNGVAVTDRGDRVGVQFDMHPALVARIQKVVGAAFNKEDKVWEVPQESRAYALVAADDMRREFALGAKEIESLKELAESKIDGAKVFHAFTRDDTQYAGKVVEVGNRYALQKTGLDKFTLHYLPQLNNVPIKESMVGIAYKKGVGQVFDQGRSQDRGRGGR